MSDQGFGSTANPYIEDTLVEEIVEVGWAGGAIVLVEACAPITLYPDASLNISPAPGTVNNGRYASGSNIPKTGDWPTVGYDGVTFLQPLLDDGTVIQNILSKFTRPMQTNVQIGDIGFSWASYKAVGRTHWQTWVWDHLAGPPLPDNDIYFYKFIDHLNTGDVNHAPYDPTDPTSDPHWNADAITTQIAARFTVATFPILINMEKGDGIKTDTIRVTQPPIFDAAPYPNMTAADFPPTRIRAYRGGTWLVGGTDVANVGGALIWDHSVPVAPFSTNETPLGSFTKLGFTP